MPRRLTWSTWCRRTGTSSLNSTWWPPEPPAEYIQSRIGLPVRLMKSGPQGGDQQIGALVAGGEVQAVIFLRDPLTAHPHEPDVSALVRLCDVHNIPLATNLATAEAVVDFMFHRPGVSQEIHATHQ